MSSVHGELWKGELSSEEVAFALDKMKLFWRPRVLMLIHMKSLLKKVPIEDRHVLFRLKAALSRLVSGYAFRRRQSAVKLGAE
jgi:hypothetical protein